MATQLLAVSAPDAVLGAAALAAVGELSDAHGTKLASFFQAPIWTEPKFVQKFGKWVQSASRIPETFSDLWGGRHGSACHKPELYAAGFGFSKNPRSDEWEVAHWFKKVDAAPAAAPAAPAAPRTRAEILSALRRVFQVPERGDAFQAEFLAAAGVQPDAAGNVPAKAVQAFFFEVFVDDGESEDLEVLDFALLAEIALQQLDERLADADAAAAGDLPAEIRGKLLRWQVPHTAALLKVLNTKQGAIDASDTGTGKTYSAIAMSILAGRRVFVVCPKNIIPGWASAAAHFGVELLGVANYELVRIGKMLSAPRTNRKGRVVRDSVACPFIEWADNPEWAPNKKYTPKKIVAWKLPADALLVFDEAHKAKNPDTQNAQVLRAVAGQPFKVLLLSATLAENPLKLQAAMIALGVIEHPSHFYSWASSYGCYRGTWGWQFRGRREDVVRLHNDLFPEYGARMRIRDIPDFPACQIQADTFYMNSEGEEIGKIYELCQKWADMIRERRLSEDAREEIAAEMREVVAEVGEHLKIADEITQLMGTPSASSVGSELTMRLFLRQLVELLKIPSMVDQTEDLVEQGHSVAVFVNFTLSRELYKRRVEALDLSVAQVYGGQAGDEREAERLKFFNNEVPVIVLNTQAGGDSISLHDTSAGGEHPRVVLISPNDSAQQIAQVIGRNWRAGGTSKTIQRIIFATDTIEAKVAENVRAKLAHINELNEGDFAAITPF